MRRAMAIVGLLLLAAPAAAQETRNDWKFEVTGYAWLMGLNADLSAGGRKVSVSKDFTDLIEHVDIGGSLSVAVSKGPWIVVVQGDYFDVSENADTDWGETKVKTNSTFLNLGAGYRFSDLPLEAKLDVLVGVRYLHLKNEMDFPGGISLDRTSDIVDPCLTINPTVPLVGKLYFNLPLSFGAGGDSDYLYELQPNLRYQFTPAVAARLGWRWLYYKYDGGRTEFDGAFQGILAGVTLSL